MIKRSRVLGAAVAALLSVAAGTATVPLPAPAAAAPATASVSAMTAAGGFRCVTHAFGHTADGRIKHRQLENSRVTVSKTTRSPVRWRPVAWSLVSLNRRPGQETTRQHVSSTDGKLRLVETRWTTGSDLSVRVIKVVGRGLPRELLTIDGNEVHWIADGALHRAQLRRGQLVRATTLPLPISGATAMTSFLGKRGTLIYYTDRTGALHVVTSQGADSTDTVLRSSGYASVTGLRSAPCESPDYSEVRDEISLLTVARASGVAHFQRVLRPDSEDGGAATRFVPVRPSDWTWRRLG